jgi:hypothetical protein
MMGLAPPENKNRAAFRDRLDDAFNTVFGLYLSRALFLPEKSAA